MRAELTHEQQKDRLHAERRLQVAGALLLGAVVLLVVVLRAGVREIFLPGWWRF